MKIAKAMKEIKTKICFLGISFFTQLEKWGMQEIVARCHYFLGLRD